MPTKAKRSPKPSAVAVGSTFVSMGNTKSSPTRSIQRNSPHKKSDYDLNFQSSHEEEDDCNNIDMVNDTKLVGNQQLITLDTAQYAIHLVSEYQTINHPSKTFRKDLFDPLWQRLKEQGCTDTLTKSHIKAKKRNSTGTTKFSNISWRSERNVDKLSIYNWVYVPPNSTFGQDKKGMYVPGVDYYNTEERLVRDVLQEISTLDDLSDLYAANVDYFSSIMPILDRAVSQGIDYKNAAASVLEDGDKKMSAKPAKRNRDDDKLDELLVKSAGKKKKGEKKSASLTIKQEDVVLPSPKHGQYYTKSEAISVITQYPKGSTERALAIEGVQVKRYVPIGKSGIYKLLRKDEQGIPINDTPWKVDKDQEDFAEEATEECAEDAANPDSEWEQNFNDLIQYTKKYGDTKVPRNWSVNPQLAEWVGLQRICSSDFICNGKRKHLITAEKVAMLKSIGFDFYVYHTNRTSRIDAYLKSNPSKKHPALDVASKDDVTEPTGEVENKDLDVASTSESIKSNLPDVPTLYMPIDVCDTGLLWNCARIVKIEKNKKAASTGITHYVTVHYEGWPEDWDEPMAWPSKLLAGRYTYTKKAKCFIKLDGVKDSWPCKINFRMPYADKKEPRDFLRKEKRVYIEPYMPTLLPSDVQERLIDQRGQWTTVGRIKPWRDVPSTELDESQTKNETLTLPLDCRLKVPPISEAVADLNIQPKGDRISWKDGAGVMRCQCKVVDCTIQSRSNSDGLCLRHYGMFVKAGRDTNEPEDIEMKESASPSDPSSDQSFESSVSQAHKEAQADRKVSKLPLNALLKGALIREEYHTKREGGDPPIITDGVICHGGFDTSIKIEHRGCKKTKDKKTVSESQTIKIEQEYKDNTAQRPWRINILWDQRFNELNEYKKRFGDTNVPSGWGENPQLATWVNEQRRYLRKYVDNEDGSHISEEKIRKLLSIGFVFNPKSNHPESEAYLQKLKSQIKEESEGKKPSTLECKVESDKSDKDDSQPESLHPMGDKADDNQKPASKVVTRGTAPQAATMVPQITTRGASAGPPPPTLPPPILINDIIYPNQGVRRVSNGWAAVLNVAGNDIFLGTYASQTEAAYAVRLAKEQSSRGGRQVSSLSAPSPFPTPNAGRFTDIMNMPIESVVRAFEEAQQEGYDPTFNLQEYMSQREQYVKHNNPSQYKREYSYLVKVKPADGKVSNKKRKKATPQRLAGGLGSQHK